MSQKKTFEEAFERLEKILEKMNSQKVSLDDALTLYEEADGLIEICQKRLNEAETKIEVLLKNRDNSLILHENDEPATEPFITKST